MKLLWHSNAPWAASGYGSQTRQVGRRIAAAGHDIEFSTNDGTRGDNEWEGHYVHGSGRDRYSRDSVVGDIAASGADWTVVLFDAWVYTQGMPDPFRDTKNVIGWIPVDHNPIPPAVLPWVSGHRVIAMSRFGYDRLREAGAQMLADTGKGIDARYVPHAVESVFRPSNGAAVRAAYSIPEDAFVVGIVAANTGTMIYDRKGFGDMAQALTVFMSRHPDAYLYVHSLTEGHEGINLPFLFRVVNAPADRIRFGDQRAILKSRISDEDMAAIYSSFDVLMATSRGEGFGLPVLEAQACGVPVIVSNWTAQPELIGDPWDFGSYKAERRPSGWMVSITPDYDAKQGAFFGKPDIGEAILALEDAYARRGSSEMSQAAIAKASEYSADRVFAEHWRPILQEMENELGPQSRQQRRREARKARRGA